MTDIEKVDTLFSRADWLRHALSTSGGYPHRRFHESELEALEWAIKRLSLTVGYENNHQKPNTSVGKRLFFLWGPKTSGLRRLCQMFRRAP